MFPSSCLIFLFLLSFFLPRKWHLFMKYPPSECSLNTYSSITNMSFLSSSRSSSTFSTSLLCSCHMVPTLLPNYAVHLLYTGILANPVILHTIENLPLYDEDLICQELIHLFHLVPSTQWYHALATPSDIPAAFGIPLIPPSMPYPDTSSTSSTYMVSTLLSNDSPLIFYILHFDEYSSP